MKLVHLGGERTVTGSCHLLQVNGLNILVDCGLAQGRDRSVPMVEWPVDPGAIDFLFLTHARGCVCFFPFDATGVHGAFESD